MPCENDIALSWVFFKSIICTRSGEYNGPHRRPCFQLKLIVLTTQSVPQLYPEICDITTYYYTTSIHGFAIKSP